MDPCFLCLLGQCGFEGSNQGGQILRMIGILERFQPVDDGAFGAWCAIELILQRADPLGIHGVRPQGVLHDETVLHLKHPFKASKVKTFFKSQAFFRR